MGDPVATWAPLEPPHRTNVFRLPIVNRSRRGGQFVEAFLGIGEAERLVPVATGPFGRRFIQTEGAEARPFPYVGR